MEYWDVGCSWSNPSNGKMSVIEVGLQDLWNIGMLVTHGQIRVRAGVQTVVRKKIMISYYSRFTESMEYMDARYRCSNPSSHACICL